LLIAPFAIAAFFAFLALGGQVVKLLWNWLVPVLFGWPPVDFWQALGLLALCRILFGGMGRSGGGHRGQSRFRQRMTERWERMSPEERERYRRSFRGRWGTFDPPSETPPA
jgi:hypothetical protein